jgi:hypothetical protein
MGKVIRVDFGRPSPFAHWKYEMPPPRRPLLRVVRISAVAAVLALVVYGCYRFVDYWTTTPAEPVAEARDSYGYFPADLLRAGDCFNEKGVEDAVGAGAAEAPPAIPAVRVLPCRSPHSAEVFSLFDIDSGHKFPNADQVAQAAVACDGALAEYVPSAEARAQVVVWYFAPSYAAWERGRPQGICVAVDRNAARRRGSLADGGTDSAAPALSKG